MAQPRKANLRLSSFAGGLNDTDPPHRIADDQLAVANDVELTQSGGIRRRDGAQVAMPPPVLGQLVVHLKRHTPSADLANSEVWAFSNAAAAFRRSTTGTTWTTIGLTETAHGTALPAVTDSVSFNGKLFIAYRKSSTADRLHCWDGTSIRRVGISTPSAPTAANTGSGSYAAIQRHYKVQFYITSSSSWTVFSDLSPVRTFTPSGSGTGVVITRPTPPDSATHWRVWASADNVSYHCLGQQPIATTTYTDSATPSNYASVAMSPIRAAESGFFTPPWSAKYLLVDTNRLLIAGSFENGRYASRVGWSGIAGTTIRALGETQVSDDERFPPENYLDLDSDEGGEITGMELLSGTPYVFKRSAIYKLTRTGDIDTPYVPVNVTKQVGALSRHSIVAGEDAEGQPCLYFLSDRGPYRLGAYGLEYMGRDIERLWSGVKKRGLIGYPHGVYDGTRGQVRWFVSTAQPYPDTQIIFHVKLARRSPEGTRGGWTRTASASKAMYVGSSAMLPASLTERDSNLAPYAAHATGAWAYQPVIWGYVTGATVDDVTDPTDGSVIGTSDVLPVVKTKTFSLGLGQHGGVDDVYVLCTPHTSPAPELSVSLERDGGAETRTATATFDGNEALLPKQIPDLTMAQAQYIAVGISSRTQQAWTVDEINLRVRREDPV